MRERERERREREREREREKEREGEREREREREREGGWTEGGPQWKMKQWQQGGKGGRDTDWRKHWNGVAMGGVARPLLKGPGDTQINTHK